MGAHVAAASVFVWENHRHGGASADPAPAIAGETFELPAPDTDTVPLSNASPSPEVEGVEAPAADGDGVAKPTPKTHGKIAHLASRAGRPSGGHTESAGGDTGGTGASALYGAVGDRSAADLATAFTRGFPQAASADPVWRSSSLGPAGDADIVLTLDDSGHIDNAQVLGNPSPALSSAIRRTMALIKGRPFTAKGKTTRLHLSATVSADAVHDGLHGDVFAIGGSYAGGEGSAFFALAIGRRIDVRVRTR